MTSELDGATLGLGDALLAELIGDEQAARAGFERMLAAPRAPAPLAARAALHLAQLESRAGRTRHALDLVARAKALAPGDGVILAGAAEIYAVVVAAAGAADIRGPRLGTPLAGVGADVAAAWAAAERTHGQVHALRLRITLLSVWTPIKYKIEVTARAVAQYRAIAERGGAGRVAATYRVGSLYHDLALDLAFAALPPELDDTGRQKLTSDLDGYILSYLRKAEAAYHACVDAPPLAEAELWRLAAETDLPRVLAVLASRTRKPAPP